MERAKRRDRPRDGIGEEMKWDSLEAAWARLRSQTQAHQNHYLGFYSSWLGGYFREVEAMGLPLDDHGFHRGDAVFEAIRIHKRALIDLGGHLRRMENSATKIELAWPPPGASLESICVELARRTQVDEGILRLYVTRGPGSFGPSPSESVGPQVYAAITRLKPPSGEAYARGVRAMVSQVPAKEAFWSQIKSCNYLQNVMMRLECQKAGYDFALCVDDRGRICEGATENFMIVSAGGELLVPRFDYTLRGTTVLKVMELARGVSALRGVRVADLTRDEVIRAREAAFVGTTLGVLPVNSLDGQMIALGPVCVELQQMWMAAISSDPQLRTEF